MPRKADFQAHLKKIEIVNKGQGEQWYQSIRIILEDIELNNENLVELRQFKPNELIFTTLESVQPTLLDKQPGQDLSGDDDKDEPITIEEGDGTAKGVVLKEFSFDK